MIDYPGGTGDGCKPIVMRYADVYLMAAEMAAYLSAADGGGLEKAKDLLGEVRRPAYAGNTDMVDSWLASLTLGSAVGNDDAAISDYQAEGTIIKAIIDERAKEFVGEFLRKQDLIRWGIYFKTILQTAQELQDWYENANYAVNRYTIEGRHELMPIPQRDLDLMPKVKQNPGWGL